MKILLLVAVLNLILFGVDKYLKRETCPRVMFVSVTAIGLTFFVFSQWGVFQWRK